MTTFKQDENDPTFRRGYSEGNIAGRASRPPATTARRLIEAIESFVNSGGTWCEKRDALLQEATESERVALDEFSGWFDSEDIGAPQVG